MEVDGNSWLVQHLNETLDEDSSQQSERQASIQPVQRMCLTSNMSARVRDVGSWILGVKGTRVTGSWKGRGLGWGLPAAVAVDDWD